MSRCKSFVVAQDHESTAVLQHHLTHALLKGIGNGSEVCFNHPLSGRLQPAEDAEDYRPKMQRLITAFLSPRSLLPGERVRALWKHVNKTLIAVCRQKKKAPWDRRRAT